MVAEGFPDHPSGNVVPQTRHGSADRALAEGEIFAVPTRPHPGEDIAVRAPVESIGNPSSVCIGNVALSSIESVRQFAGLVHGSNLTPEQLHNVSRLCEILEKSPDPDTELRARTTYGDPSEEETIGSIIINTGSRIDNDPPASSGYIPRTHN